MMQETAELGWRKKACRTMESHGTRNCARFQGEMDERRNVSFDRFIRTTEPEQSSLGPG